VEFSYIRRDSYRDLRMIAQGRRCLLDESRVSVYEHGRTADDINLSVTEPKSLKIRRSPLAAYTDTGRTVQNGRHESLNVASKCLVRGAPGGFVVASHSKACHRDVQEFHYFRQAAGSWSGRWAKHVGEGNDDVGARL